MAISTVITTYNDEKELPILLDQILEQKLLPDEIIIADGGSTDETINIIKGYEEKTKNSRILLLSGGRLNISEGLNLAIKNSSFSKIAIMATGNSYGRDYLYKLNKKMDETDADICFVPFTGRETNRFTVLYNRVFLNGEKGNRFPTNHGMLIKKKVYEMVGLYYEKFIYAGEDAEFLNRILHSKIKMEVEENPKIIWSTPQSVEQLKKQIKWYMIAQLQIDGVKAILSIKRVLLQLSAIVLLIISVVLNLPILCALLMGIIALLSYNKAGIREAVLWNYYNYYCLFFMIKNIKYSKAKYRVKSDSIPRL